MRIREEAFPFAGPLIVAAVVLVVAGLWMAALLPLALGVFVCAFFRDPERTPPPEADRIVSPADGRVLSVTEKDGRICISVFMSVFNVHVNRAPVSGVVKGVKHFPGTFIAAWRDKASMDNERNSILLDHAAGRMEMVQIAGLVARRIVCWTTPGTAVVRGERLGLIRFGSRVDLHLPAGAVQVLVSPGDRVRAGSSALARFWVPA